MSERLAILLIEDNDDHARFIERILRRAAGRYELQRAATLAAAHEWLAFGGHSAALVDLTLPDSSGPQTVAAVRAQCPELPIIVLTSLAHDEVAQSALDRGAQDYLLKDALTSEQLDRAIRYAIQRQRNYSQIERLLGKLEAARALLERKNHRLARLYRTAHRFVDHVSHEFRTPLTVVKEYVSLIRDGLLGPINQEQQRFLDVVNNRADDLNHMVDDMLDVSKLEAGILSVLRTPARLTDIVQRVGPGLQRRAALQEVRLEFDVPADLPEVYCDAEKIGRVLVNLVVNAVKFSRQPGHVRVTAALDADADEARLSVSDNGPGIHSEDLPLLFRRFKQLGIPCRGSTKGFGLGLSIARELVELNLGEISVESVVGQGSTFSFSVPRAQPEAVLRRYLRRRSGRGEDLPIALVSASVVADGGDGMAEDLTAFLSGVLRRHDLLFRMAPCLWHLVLAVGPAELRRAVHRIQQTLDDTNRNRPGPPLPAIRLEILGHWATPDCLDELLPHFRAAEPALARADHRQTALTACCSVGGGIAIVPTENWETSATNDEIHVASDGR